MAEANRKTEIARLVKLLGQSQRTHRSAQRAVFNLAGDHASSDLKPLRPDEIQQLLRSRQLLLVYSIGRDDSYLFVVPPPGQPIRAVELRWPIPVGNEAGVSESESPARQVTTGSAVTSTTLAAVVSQYVRLMQIEGAMARGVEPLPEDSDRSTDAGQVAFRLFQALTPADVWQELNAAELVFLVPDDALHRLPFESLVVEAPAAGDGRNAAAEGRRYWLDAGPAIAYGASATVLVNRRQARDEQLHQQAQGRQPTSLAVALGNPIFDRSGGVRAGETQKLVTATRHGYRTRYGRLAPLPGTEKEVLRIKESLLRVVGDQRPSSRVVTLLGEDATRTKLFLRAGGTRFLHLATHGLVDETDNVCWNSLALTQPQVSTADDFGFLTLNDLFQNWRGKLSATELVVLSACDSQRGRLSGGEGVFGMPWGFMYAGSPAVIASLWQVDDKTTADLMGNLYARILDTADHSSDQTKTAKLSAFVAVRKSLRQKHPEPYFWAPFIYLGDPR